MARLAAPGRAARRSLVDRPCLDARLRARRRRGLSVLTLAAPSAATRAIWPTIVAAERRDQPGDHLLRAPRVLGRPPRVGADRLAGWTPGRRSIYFTLVPIAGVAVGWPLGMVLAGRLDERFMAPLVRPGVLGSSIVVALLVTALFQQFFRTKARQIAAENAATEAQLRLLQPQIEPHFLFNTLANVVSLMASIGAREVDARGVIEYLRASLSGLGHGRPRSATRST